MNLLDKQTKRIVDELKVKNKEEVNLFEVDTLQINTTGDHTQINTTGDNTQINTTGDHTQINKIADYNIKDYKSFTDFVEGKNTVSCQDKFNPYEDNSGTSVSVKLSDSIIVAADTRHCSDMGIYSRNTTKILKIGDFLLTITGFYADGIELYNRLKYQVLIYESFNKISIHSLANLASKIMYSKRLFPFYSYVTLSGFSNEEPFVYSFDCLGHFEKVDSVCNGSGSPLIQPLLDSFIEKKNWLNESPVVNEVYAKNIVRRAFDAASERDVKTGDNLEIYVIKKDSISREVERLRQD